MPRAPSSTKRQQGAASTRDTRHDNGLVGPGKRIAKQKSQNPLDGSPRPAAADSNAALSSTAQQPPSSSSSSSAAAALANGSAKHGDDTTAMAPEHRTTESLRRASLGTYSETSSADSVAMPNGIIPASEDAPMRIDVNAAKNTNVHRDTGPIDYALTVLRSCPLHDTIAILIILMQLSPVALSSIYMLFTLLTFVPPVTTSSGLSLTDIFDGVSTTSLWTLIILDLVFFLVWIIVGMQEIVLDFAQVVIALTLGGGASSRAGTTHNIFLCTALILFSHFGRIPAIKRFAKLGALVEGGPFASSDAGDSLEPSVSAYAKKGAYGWVRSALAIHILMQGIVRYIRDWYLRREKRDQLSQSQLDPEAGKGASFSGDASTDGVPNTPDPEVIAQTTATTVSSKKRRKQSAQVRIRQPLWAALASTKIVMVKEYELSHAASESAGSNATDIHNLGNAPFNTQPEQIWICYVGCDEVCFNTSHFPDNHASGKSHENGNAASSGIDTSKPFYVRVNNAVWQPTRIIPVESGEEEGCQGTRWTGDIYGLTPMSKYECEFVSTRTGEVLFSTSVRTIPAKLRDSDSRSHGAPRQYRHESPATTLKNSIAGMEAKLADEKARLKALRKENNRRTNAAKKEIERLTAAVQSAGGNDEKLRQKIAQNSTHQKQAEQSILDLETELKELETIPEEVLTEYRQKQDAFKAEKAQFEGARATFKSVKSSYDDEIKVLEEDQASLQAKRTKIAARLAKVENEHARITDANARGLDEAERRRQERAAFEADVARAEQEYSERLAAIRARNDEKTQNAANMAAVLQSYINNFNHSEAPFESGQFSGTYGPVPWAQASPHYSSNAMWSPGSSGAPAPALLSTAPAGPPPLFPHQQPPPYQAHPFMPKSRGRSSSMLSDISGFTQSTDDGEIANGSNNGSSSSGNNTASFGPAIQNQGSTPSFHAHPGLRGVPNLPFVRTRKRSDGGSGSGSGSGLGSEGSSVHSGSRSGGSVRDPTSPI